VSGCTLLKLYGLVIRSIEEPLPYSSIYGSQGVFTSTGTLRTVKVLAQQQAIQLTLFLHRMSLTSEVPPKNGYYMYKTGYPEVFNGVVTFNAADATYNSVTVGTGQKLVGIVGIADFSIQGSLGWFHH
jgi:hypothetical protein